MKDAYKFKSSAIIEKGPVIYNAEEAPFSIHGLYDKKENGIFTRMPREVAEKVSKKVELLHTNTAGARLRFATDSSFIAIGAVYPPMTFSSPRSALLSGANSCSFDLYADGEHVRVMWHEDLIQRGSVVSFDISEGQYEAYVSFEKKKTRQITLCFPSFVNVSEVWIGLDRDAALEAAEPYVNDIPVVFYGSSITQGACASRSGNTYQNILSRRFNFDYINLGFAGACKAEETIIDYLCSLKTSLLVYDYDHNTPSVEYLRQTHLSGLRKLRNAHPDIPIILMSKPNQNTGREEAYRRMAVIEESYEIIKTESDAPVHFVNGQKVFDSCDREMMTVDGTHPTDLGFYCMANALSDIFRLYFL